jgi:hypothetical protein
MSQAHRPLVLGGQWISDQRRAKLPIVIASKR